MGRTDDSCTCCKRNEPHQWAADQQAPGTQPAYVERFKRRAARRQLLRTGWADTIRLRLAWIGYRLIVSLLFSCSRQACLVGNLPLFFSQAKKSPQYRRQLAHSVL